MFAKNFWLNHFIEYDVSIEIDWYFKNCVRLNWLDGISRLYWLLARMTMLRASRFFRIKIQQRSTSSVSSSIRDAFRMKFHGQYIEMKFTSNYSIHIYLNKFSNIWLWNFSIEKHIHTQLHQTELFNALKFSARAACFAVIHFVQILFVRLKESHRR